MMAPAARTENTSAVALYEKAVRSPSDSMVESLKQKYRRSTSQYLPILSDSDMYRAFLRLEDLVTSYQEAESKIYASIRNNIQRVEHNKCWGMLSTQSGWFSETTSCLKMLHITRPSANRETARTNPPKVPVISGYIPFCWRHEPHGDHSSNSSRRFIEENNYCQFNLSNSPRFILGLQKRWRTSLLARRYRHSG